MRVGSRWLVLVCLSLAACAQEQVDQGRIRVAVSILPQAEAVRRVGGEKVGVVVMIPPGANPATYELAPSQLRKLSKADMYVRVGENFIFEKAWMNKIVGINPGMPVVDCSEGVELLGADPHIWLSPKNAWRMARNVFRGLAQIDPDSRVYYEQNLKGYQQELDELGAEIAQVLAGLQNRKFMVYHPAWAYFARDYSLEQIAIEKEGKHPTPRGIARLIKLARQDGITTIFASPQFRTDNAELIAR